MLTADRNLLDRVGEALEAIDQSRLRISAGLDDERRVTYGQFMTPATVAGSMARMFTPVGGKIRIADPGAGIGSLGAAVVARLLTGDEPPAGITLTMWEVDPVMLAGLEETMGILSGLCDSAGTDFTADIRREDFLAYGAGQLGAGMLSVPEEFDMMVMNPPYRKIHRDSAERSYCRTIGLETTNLYTGFLAVGSEILRESGELVAIVPRSFTNGTYFTAFRARFTGSMTFRDIHVYESRSKAFSDDAVLQENLIFRAVRTRELPDHVAVTSSYGPDDEHPSYRDVPYDELIRPGDEKRVIHIVADKTNARIAQRVMSLPAALTDLGITVSTGRVVDFRAEDLLRNEAVGDIVPLIYPAHLRGGHVTWPMPGGRKPNALLNVPAAADLLVPEGLYVLTKRFTAKEERRRIVAMLYDPADVAPGPVGFENHLNYYHVKGRGLDRPLAAGLRAYLNSTLVDLYFRQFSGHTQVNAGDLKTLRYPSLEQLRRLGEIMGQTEPAQRELDQLIDRELFMADGGTDPVRVSERVNEGIEILRQLGFPKRQVNERSSLTLLALLGLGPADDWPQAHDPLIGITPMMKFFEDRYGKTYAPNTRETVRRQTVHQFLAAGLILQNPDDPSRATNSDKNAYQIEASALELLRSYGTADWGQRLEAYLSMRETLSQKYAAERKMSRIPVRLPDGAETTLSGGGQNVLIKHVIEEFCSRWTPGGNVLYIGDTGGKLSYYDREGLARLGIVLDEHGKIPDVIVHHEEKNWLVVIEAAGSHGPVDAKRHGELVALFRGSSAPLVYVTAFIDMKTMLTYGQEIAWETEVWVASRPTHLIHFDGERFLGPYPT